MIEIQIKKEHASLIEDLNNQIVASKTALQFSSEQLTNNRRKMFSAIEELYPETIGKEYTIDHKFGIIFIPENKYDPIRKWLINTKHAAVEAQEYQLVSEIRELENKLNALTPPTTSEGKEKEEEG